jgi:putative sterol carrier protein
LTSDSIFERLQTFIQQDPVQAQTVASQVRAAIVFEIHEKKTGKIFKKWLLSMRRDSEPSLQLFTKDLENTLPNNFINATLVIDNDSVISLMQGKLSAEYAYMRGLLKIKGQMGAALKLRSFLETAKDLLK